MDDPSSVKSFEDWMKTMFTNNQSNAIEETTAAAAADEDEDEVSSCLASENDFD